MLVMEMKGRCVRLQRMRWRCGSLLYVALFVWSAALVTIFLKSAQVDSLDGPDPQVSRP